MFFVIAGVQPKTRNVDDHARRCPRCGFYQAYIRRVDHYLSVFFIPLIRIKKGAPYLFCRRCEQPAGTQANCRRCARPLNPGYAYCPSCGEQQ